MILSDDEVLHAWDDDPTWFQPKFKTSHLEANARIKELEDENRCLEMRLEDCRLEAEGVAVYIHEAKRAENRADRLAVIADALAVELSESYTAPEIYDAWKCAQHNQDRADRAEAKLRDMAEAAEWRDECRETAPFRPTWAGSDNSRIRCCNLDYFGNEELAKTKQMPKPPIKPHLRRRRRSE